MIFERYRPLAAVLAGLVTSLVMVWLDAALAVERLRVALGGMV
jgi:hypothetical protein